MIRIDRRSAARTLAVAALVPGALAVAAGASVADAPPNKAQLEYAERRAQEVRDLQGTKAQIEYQERLAQPADGSGSGTTSGSTTGSEFPWAIALTTLGVAAVGAGGAAAAVRYNHRHHPHPV